MKVNNNFLLIWRNYLLNIIPVINVWRMKIPFHLFLDFILIIEICGDLRIIFILYNTILLSKELFLCIFLPIDFSSEFNPTYSLLAIARIMCYGLKFKAISGLF